MSGQPESTNPPGPFFASAVQKAASRLILPILIYFLAVAGFVALRAPDPWRMPLLAQKLSFAALLFFLGRTIRRPELSLSRTNALVMGILLTCLLSMMFSSACGLGENYANNTVLLFLVAGLTFLQSTPALLTWGAAWAGWALMSWHHHVGPGEVLHQTLLLIGFQLASFSILHIRRSDLASQYQLREQDRNQSQALARALREAEAARSHLDSLVEERTAELRLAYEELRLSALQREDIQQASERLQEQLLQAQKMESLGRLAGGVAHDFNNLLTVILGNLELAQKMPSDEDHLDFLHQAELAAQRAAELSGQLLAFSRRQVLQVRRIDLAEILRTAVRLIERLLGEDLQFEVDYGPPGLTVQGDPAQLQQVVMNLTVNARDAMPSGGKLTLKLQLASRNDQEMVCLEVSDTGQGIDPEVQPRIFEPFFTTKPFGQGTGLGLATVDGIVSQHQGLIEVDSELGQGTSFFVYLPLAKAQSQDSSSRKTRRPTLGNARLLLVEDDAQVRSLALRILRQSGYKVMAADTGEQALQIAREADQPFDMLVTDVVMPGMDGASLADQLRQIQSECKVLFVSGYTDDRLAHFGVDSDGYNFLAKPFSAVSLCRKVEAILKAEQ